MGAVADALIDTSALEGLSAQLARQREELDRRMAALEELRPAWEAASEAANAARTRVEATERAVLEHRDLHTMQRAMVALGCTHLPPFIDHRTGLSERMGWRPTRLRLAAVAGTGAGLYRHKGHGGVLWWYLLAPGATEVELWEERGKRKPPPDGGRWRWLKVRPQELLTEGGHG